MTKDQLIQYAKTGFLKNEYDLGGEMTVLTYRNPVWPHELADPFVLKWQGNYYAYGTSSFSRDRIFPVLRSPDLVHWDYLGGALELLESASPLNYWAPEVAEHEGRFCMYYSAGTQEDDATHRLHVAIAENPGGPFKTVSQLLPDEGFTIDAHPYHEPDEGRGYLFFAKDFFDERVGTGLAVVPLDETMTQVAGPVTTVLRASSDWQIYERNRTLYGRSWEAWHTVEGPFVVKHEGLYYCFYSGGPWHSLNYGVSYGVADHVLGPYHDEWSLKGPAGLQASEKVLGPGHNSIVLGPDNRSQFIVYHAWDPAKTARRMCIDPLVWGFEGPTCAGPTTEEQTIEL